MEIYYDLFHKNEDSNDEIFWKVMYWGYFSMFLVTATILLMIWVWIILKLRQEYKSPLLDIYRIIQFIILFVYIICILLTNALRFIQSFEIYNLATFIYVWLGYYVCEVIHSIWWINFLLHLKLYVKYSDRNSITSSILKTIKFYEKWILVVLLFILGWYLVQWFYTNILTFKTGWTDWHPFYKYEDWKPECQKLTDVYFRIFYANSIIGACLVMIKAILAIYLLVQMKTHLHFYYTNKRFHIIWTTIVGILSVVWKFVYNYYVPLREQDLKYNFTARKHISYTVLAIQSCVMLIDIFFPIVAIIYNIQTINFQWYLTNLMKGWGLEKYVTKWSIFIKAKRKYASEANESTRQFISGSIFGKVEPENSEETDISFISK